MCGYKDLQVSNGQLDCLEARCSEVNFLKFQGKRFIWLPCRHHIMELIAGAAYKTALNEKTASSNIQLFEEFRKVWPDIDKSSYESCSNDDYIKTHLLPVKEELAAFIRDQLSNFPQVRDDYKELLMLSLLVMGETSRLQNWKLKIVRRSHLRCATSSKMDGKIDLLT